MNIVFLGATGMIGNVVIRHLAKAGRDITALVRTPESAEKTLPDSVSVKRGNVADLKSLDPIKDADVVIFMLSIDPKTADPKGFNADLDGVKAVIKVAAQGKCPHIIYLSSLLEQGSIHDWWVLEAKKEATRSVKTSGLPHTILRPSNLMENLPNRFQRGNSISYIGKPKETGWWIAAEDIGRMLNAHLDRLLDTNYDIPMQGPQAMTAKEASERYATAKGLKVSGAPMAILRLVGIFVPELRYAAKISTAMNTAPEAFQSDQAWEDLGKPKVTIEAFALDQP